MVGARENGWSVREWLEQERNGRGESAVGAGQNGCSLVPAAQTVDSLISVNRGKEKGSMTPATETRSTHPKGSWVSPPAGSVMTRTSPAQRARSRVPARPCLTSWSSSCSSSRSGGQRCFFCCLSHLTTGQPLVNRCSGRPPFDRSARDDLTRRAATTAASPPRPP